MRRPLLLFVLVSLLAPFAFAGSASAKPQVGVGDNSPQIFTDPAYALLKSKFTRKIVPYDTVLNGGADLAELDAYMAGARRTGVDVLVSFNPTRSHRFATKAEQKRDLPSVKQFETAFKAFRARYPFVKTISPWNEINSPTQPTSFNYTRAAQFTNSAAKLCKGCTIVAGDWLDAGFSIPAFKRFSKALKIKPKVWGLHNYQDTNRKRSKTTKTFLRVTGNAQVWLTETGGLVDFTEKFPYNPTRAANALKYMFTLANTNKRIKRLYTYSFYGVPRTARFDAGLLEPTGVPRPGYCVVKQKTNPQGTC